MDHNENGSFRMSQPFLIERILNEIPGMQNCNPAKDPATAATLLTKDITGESHKENWNYRTIIGMLNFLVNSTQPELDFAVHQCARFCSDPKHSHEQAVKRILR